MKKIEIPIVVVCTFEEVDVISTSNLRTTDYYDDDFRQGNSRGPWGNGPWDN